MVLYFQNLEKKNQFTKIIQHWPQNDSTTKTSLGTNFLLVQAGLSMMWFFETSCLASPEWQFPDVLIDFLPAAWAPFLVQLGSLRKLCLHFLVFDHVPTPPTLYWNWFCIVIWGCFSQNDRLVQNWIQGLLWYHIRSGKLPKTTFVTKKVARNWQNRLNFQLEWVNS